MILTDGRRLLTSCETGNGKAETKTTETCSSPSVFDETKLDYSGNIFSEKLIKLGEPDTTNVGKDVHYRTRRIDNSLNLNRHLQGKHFLNLTAAYSDYLRYNNSYFLDMNSGEETISEKASDS